MKLNRLEQYYNKFNEDKRLLSRHGQVEFFVTLEYIKKFIDKKMKIADIGAGTGRYSETLSTFGCDVTAVELVKKNVRVMEERCKNCTIFQGNALNLKMLENESFDITLLFGPMYHLFIFVAYCMNDYSIITYAFKEGNLQETLKNGKLDEDFHTKTNEEDLYSYDTLENINLLKEKSGLKRKIIFSPDGPTDYIRPTINKMSEQDFEVYKKYVLAIAERQDLLGAGSHLVDVLRKK